MMMRAEISNNTGLNTSDAGTGYASTFAPAGFKIAGRRVLPRPIVCHDLKAIAR
jgi:hypothetical protein